MLGVLRYRWVKKRSFDKPVISSLSASLEAQLIQKILTFYRQTVIHENIEKCEASIVSKSVWKLQYGPTYLVLDESF